MKNKLKKVKLKGNESFNIREGWLRKGMRLLDVHPDLFSREDSMELLGVGSKMVKSIRYWMQATGLTEERVAPGGRGRIQTLTEGFGEIIHENDPYIEDPFTLSLLHYKLVSNEELCIVWNVFFNEFEAMEFTKEDMIEMCKVAIQKKMDEHCTFSANSFADDCTSVLRMYLRSNLSEDPDENLGCPLSELGLLQKKVDSKGSYIRVSPTKKDLEKMAVLYVMVCNLEQGKNSISLDELLYAPNNIGRIFHLSRIAINEYLDQLRIGGYLTLTRTAGLNMIYIKENLTPSLIMTQYYENALTR